MNKIKRNIIIDKIHYFNHIPDDWGLIPLTNAAWFQEGPGLRNWQFTKDGMKVINITNLKDGLLNLESTERYISIEEFQKMYKHFAIDDKDIVMASSGATYCKTAIVKDHDLPLMMNTSVIRFKPIDNTSLDYLFAFLGSFLLKRQIDFLITGGAQPNFGPIHLNQTVIPIPSKNEQKTIAHILGVMDTVINKNNQLIAQKELCKKWLMQNLLSGKKRLKGFSGDWKDKKLKDVLNQAGIPLIPEEHKLYQQIGIRSHTKGIFHKEKVTGAALGNKRVFWIEPDCFVVNIVFAWEHAIAKTTEKEIGMIASHRFPMYKPKNGILDLSYLLFYFKSPRGKYLLGLASPGGAGRNKTLGKSEFMKLQIPVPSIEEQKAIAQILSTADKEIQLLKAKTEKLREQKKGMMQVLLTGKKRLKSIN